MCMHSMCIYRSTYAWKKIKSRLLAMKTGPDAVIRTVFVMLQS